MIGRAGGAWGSLSPAGFHYFFSDESRRNSDGKMNFLGIFGCFWTEKAEEQVNFKSMVNDFVEKFAEKFNIQQFLFVSFRLIFPLRFFTSH